MGAPRLMIVVLGAAAIVVVAVVALGSGSWWVLAPAVLALLGTTLFVVGYVQRITAQGGKPDPRAEARIDEESARRPPDRPAKDYEVFH